LVVAKKLNYNAFEQWEARNIVVLVVQAITWAKFPPIHFFIQHSYGHQVYLRNIKHSLLLKEL